MPIRFACPTCEQRLVVGSHKAGQSAVCPKCKATVAIPSVAADRVPVEEPPEPPPVGVAPPLTPILAEERPLFDFNGGMEVVYEPNSPPRARPTPTRTNNDAVDFDRIALPRYIVFVQGILLAVVGVICFLLGMAVGGAVSESGSHLGATPVTVSGTVFTTRNGARSPDSGAVVIFLPFNAKPDEKASLIGLRPGDDPSQGDRGRNLVRLWGGDIARCDQLGAYSVTLPEQGRYFQLVLSANAEGETESDLAPQQIAQLVRFFDITEDPLNEFRVAWRVEGLRTSRKINVDFD